MDDSTARVIFWRILVALCIASITAAGGVYVTALLHGALNQNVHFLAAATGVTALASGLLFVYPVLVFVARLRRPHFGIAAIWGASIAAVIARVLVSRDMDWQFIATYAVVGAASGIVYAAVARVLSVPDF